MDLYLGNRLSLSATYYDQTAINLIDIVSLGVTEPLLLPTYQYQNVGEIDNWGWEFEGSFDAYPIRVDATFSTMNSDVKKLSPTYGGSLKPGDKNRRVPEHVAGATLVYNFHRGSTSLEFSRIGSWLETDVLAYYGGRYGDDPYLGSYQAYLTDYDPITKLHFQIERSINDRFGASIRVENLTNNQDGEPTNSSLTRGRAVTVSLRATY